MSGVPAVRREQIQSDLEAPLSYKSGVEAVNDNELVTKGYVDGLIPGSVGAVFDCAVGVVVGDVVYLSDVNKVDKAFAGTPGLTEDAVGVVTELPSPGKARVVAIGRVLGGFVGLTAGVPYYLSDSVPGGITSTAPDTDGHKVQKVGIAASTTELYIQLSVMTVML